MDSNEGFIVFLDSVPDMRAERGKHHKLIDILFIALCTVLSNGHGFNDMVQFATYREDWLRKYLELPFGIPSYHTFRRAFLVLDTNSLKECLLSWAESLRSETEGQIIALDGKTLRHSFDTHSGQKSLHLVNAWVTDLGVALGCNRVDAKSNEIPAALEFIDRLSIKGRTVTLDALGCQTEIAAKIVDKGGDYLLCAKGNQPGLHDDLKGFFADCGDFEGIEHDYFESIEKGHGRIEERRCWAVEGEAEWLGIHKRWKNVRTIASIERTRTIKGKSSAETTYYITTLKADAEKIASVARAHWSIENKLHWVLDVTMNEDMNRVMFLTIEKGTTLITQMGTTQTQVEPACRSGSAGLKRNALRFGSGMPPVVIRAAGGLADRRRSQRRTPSLRGMPLPDPTLAMTPTSLHGRSPSRMQPAQV
jgi:predicted transposase YbfD/YdcC